MFHIFDLRLIDVFKLKNFLTVQVVVNILAGFFFF